MARKNTSKIDSLKRRKTGEKEFKEFSLLGLKKHIPRGRYRAGVRGLPRTNHSTGGFQ